MLRNRIQFKYYVLKLNWFELYITNTYSRREGGLYGIGPRRGSKAKSIHTHCNCEFYPPCFISQICLYIHKYSTNSVSFQKFYYFMNCPVLKAC